MRALVNGDRRAPIINAVSDYTVVGEVFVCYNYRACSALVLATYVRADTVYYAHIGKG